MDNRVSGSGMAIGRQADLTQMKIELARLTAEMSSGRKADPAREMGVGASLLYKLHGEVQQGASLKSVASQAGLRLATMQTALGNAGTVMQEISTQILQAEALEGDGYATLAAAARGALESLVGLLNTRFDQQNVFAGTDSAAPPVAAPAGLLAQVQSLLGGAVGGGGPLDADEAGALMADVRALFEDADADGDGDATTQPPAFYGLVYGADSRTGDGRPTQVRIGAGETLSYDVRADNQAFRDAFQLLALLSTLDAPDSQLSEAARRGLLDQAGALMRGAQSQLTTLSGVLGIKQARLESVAEIQDRAIAAATAQINDLETVDYYTIADRVSALELQLNATYSVTARLNQLSLVNYL